MKVLTFETEEQWLEARRGKITGTRLKDLIVKRGYKPKIGYYEIIAERVAIPHDGSDVMLRGKELEEEALERFAKETGKKVSNDLVLWCRDDNEDIALSPDGVIDDTEAAEVKCLSSARHLEALLTKEIPDEYRYQGFQYFVVNDKLQTLYFVFYDPRMPKDFFWLEMHRDEAMKVEIQTYLELERQTLLQISEVENQLTF